MEFSHRNIVQKSIKAHLSPEATKKADVEPGSLVKLYTACIRSVLKYSCQVFHKSLPQYLSDKLERIQKRALETIFPDLNYKEATAKAKLGTLFERRDEIKCYLVRSRLHMSTRDTNFGTYYQLNVDHVIVNGGIKEFTRCH